MAGTFNIKIEKGATYNRVITWYADLAKTELVDLTGFTALLQVRKEEDSPVILSLTSSSGITLGGAAGTIEIEITKTQTQALQKFLNAKYQLKLTDSGGSVSRLLEGTFTVDEEIAA